MNVFTFTGRLAADCEQKQIGDSTLTHFRAAVDSGYGDGKVTTWLTCNMWGKRGESVAPYLLKGTQVAISGELTNREYTRDDGAKGYSLEVRVSELTLLGSKDRASGSGSASQSGGFRDKPAGPQSTDNGQARDGVTPNPYPEDDCPF